ncbi:bifunctional [glutamate--ammonia ligase]-adenylyl-L-tyrosine phosphorylase/[glutamate--ammonia-ligase] adenylyltransferase [Inmirania thermothiophila]|uniref:Bifunctional glutamine synthetase adenylyltransferase/adenylyl-removing enzyme n=1 Tax=Inmirania thermothiophila TaxID=1750597 RepID=A0A3N1XWN1_9GAMM|nr:bifunctional [glutamate--ammonia ligase]-adenylyl-L-tyrosine phosphorylase/[glutamate--ammonia-ligase] adenylyltransferase [Inmirania thermothiophila]ROR29602.1 glutamate-ammonia-ligase adenylyltransferase [Inmirania thermothiophila]
MEGVPAGLPAALAQRVEERVGALATAVPALAGREAQAAQVLAASDFVAESLAREPAMLQALLASGDLDRPADAAEMRRRVAAALADAADEAALMAALRRVRRREMVRIAWRDILGLAAIESVLEETSWLAEACIDEALARLEAWSEETWGRPAAAEDGQARLVVLGLGKLGAWELNFSSDVDLVFAYPARGTTSRGLDHEEYFTRLARRLIRVLDERTADGFVFRVDTRLRPYGKSGPLVMSFAQMEAYYQIHGREWERYALIKARPVAGARAAGETLLESLRPFVYRRYLDYGAFEALREMKAMIVREVRRRGMEDDIKLGPGGIREIEFIGQAFQLVRGGRMPALRERRLLRVLEVLGREGLLPEAAATELAAAYRFLRRVENRLQQLADAQTHRLPGDETARARIGCALGFDGWEAFSAALAAHRRRVETHFEGVVTAPQAEAGGADEACAAVWGGALGAAEAEAVLARLGYGDAAAALRRLAALRDGRLVATLSETARRRLDRLMPLLLAAVGRAEGPDRTLPRVLDVVEAIARRSAYVALLLESPLALSQLVRLCAASPWIARLLARHPVLLDELMDPRTLYAPPRREALARELDALLEGAAADDLEEQMERLRQFRQVNVLRVAAADVSGALPLMVVSDHLTEIAEVVLQRVLALARAQLVARHGEPWCEDAAGRRRAGFAVVAYGKLGGIELGYGSDLDLVFLHDSTGAAQQTDGPRPLDNATFFARLAQRIIHILTTPTAGGVLYEVDTRLRPSGKAGLLVSSLDAFARYQREEAWTWEHQALVRARVVAGDAGLAQRFAEVRAEVLGRPRDPEALRREVREMRARQRRELDRSDTAWFDLKHGAGGIGDIEFLVQYLVLRWGGEDPEVLRWTDNIRQLEALAAGGHLAAADAEALAEAYRRLRGAVHRAALQEQPARAPRDAFVEERACVRALWQRIMEDGGGEIGKRADLP